MTSGAFTVTNAAILGIAALFLALAKFSPGPAGEYARAIAWFLVFATAAALAMRAVLAYT